MKNLLYQMKNLFMKNLSHQEIIDKYKGDWEKISKHQTLSESFINEFQDKVKWKFISEYQELSESFIREYQDKVNWKSITAHQKLSESFIREFQNRVYWHYISKYQKLSDSLIRDFQDKVCWCYISRYQKHINYDHLIKSLPKPSKGSLVFCKHKGHGIVLNVEDFKYEVLFMESQQITSITNKYDILNLKVVG